MKSIIFAILSLTLLLGAGLQADASSAPLLLDFIDAGEGDAVLIRTPEAHAILVDTGNLASGIDVLSFLQSQKLSKIDGLFLTHPHLDHIGGVFAILKLMNVENVYDNGEPFWPTGAMQDVGRWYKQLVRSRQDYKALKRGVELRFGDLKIHVLGPPAERTSDDWNTNSLVLLLEYGSIRALLMGDANKAAEKTLLEDPSNRFALQHPIQILKAGHHAAKDTASKAFVEKLHPKAVFVSINSNNIHDFPDNSVLDRYKKNGAQVFRTDLYGSIRVEAFASGSFHVLYQGKLKIL